MEIFRVECWWYIDFFYFSYLAPNCITNLLWNTSLQFQFMKQSIKSTKYVLRCRETVTTTNTKQTEKKNTCTSSCCAPGHYNACEAVYTLSTNLTPLTFPPRNTRGNISKNTFALRNRFIFSHPFSPCLLCLFCPIWLKMWCPLFYGRCEQRGTKYTRAHACMHVHTDTRTDVVTYSSPA